MKKSIQLLATLICLVPRLNPVMLRQLALACIVLLALQPHHASATVFTKKNGATAYTNATAWVTAGGPPGPADTAEWNAATGAQASGGLGGSMTWAGMSFTDAGANHSIGNTSGMTLTNGSGGIAITSANAASKGLTVDCLLALGADQSWTVDEGSLTVKRTVATGGFTLTLAGAKNKTVSAVISGTGGLIINAGPITDLQGLNTFTGNTTLTAGSVTLTSAETPGTSGPLGKQAAAAAGTIILNGGYLKHTASNQNDYSGRFSTAASQKYNLDSNGQTVTWATALTSSGGTLTKIGTGVLTLSGANTYDGETTISGGVLRQDNASSPLGSGLLTINGGVLELKTPTTMTRTLGAAAGNLRVTGGTSGFNAQGATANVTIDNNAATVVTWGTANFNPAVLVLNNSSASAHNINFNNVLDLGGSVSTDNRTINVDTSTSGGTATLAGVVQGTGGIIKTGQGILRISSACTYNSATAIQNGTLQIISGNNRLPVDTILTLGSGTTSGKLILGTSTARNQTLAGLLTSGTGTTNAVVGQASANSGLTLNISGGENIYSGVLGGVGANENNLALTKSGTGTLTLTGINTYTGNTTVNAGKLALSGSGSIAGSLNIIVGTTAGSSAILDVSGVAGGFTLGSSQTLKGHGTVNGAVTVNGTLSPGASVGTLAFGGDLTLAGNLLIEVDKSLSPSNDVVTVSGTLTNAGSGTVTVTNLNGGLPLAAGDSFQLFNKPVLNGGALTIVSAGGEAWTNKLAVDGSIAVIPAGVSKVPATNLTIVATGPTSFSLGGFGAANSAYNVYAYTNVTTPMTNWWLIGTTNSDAGGVIQFLDPQATNEQRFYRFGQ